MKKSIRFVSIFLVVFMIAGLFSGCKKNPEDLSSEIEYVYNYIKNEDSDNDGNGSSNTGNSDSGNQESSDSANPNAGNSNSGNSNSGGAAINKTERTNNYKDRARDLKGRTITMVAGYEGDAAGSTAYKQYRELEKLLNCKFVQKKMTDYKALYTSILAGNPMADIISVSASQALTMANKNMLTPLNDLPSLDLSMSRWSQAGIKETTLNGKVYGYGQSQPREFILYNKDMFKQNGWEDLYTLQSNGKLTWDKLFEIMKKAASLNGKYGLVPTYDLGGLGETMVHANGVGAITRVGDTKQFKYMLDSTSARNALNKLLEWNKVENAIYNSEIAGWDSGREVFYSGKAAIAIVDFFMLNTILANAEFEVGAALFPAGPDYNSDYVAFVFEAKAIPAGVKNPDDVVLFDDMFMDMNYGTHDEKTADSDWGDISNIDKVMEKQIALLNGGKYVNDFGSDLVKKSYKEIANGETSVAAAITAISQKADAYMKDFWN